MQDFEPAAADPEPPPRQRVNLHIEELVLEGFDRRDRHAIAAALEQELSRLLLAQRGSAFGKQPLALERIQAAGIRIDAAARPQAVGAQIARSVFRSLRPATTFQAKGQPR